MSDVVRQVLVCFWTDAVDTYLKKKISDNGATILLLISTDHWGHISQSEPSLQTNVHE